MLKVNAENIPLVAAIGPLACLAGYAWTMALIERKRERGPSRMLQAARGLWARGM